MPKLFEETTINSLLIPNRFIRSATWECLADEQGNCSEQMIGEMIKLVHGKVGLIITGHAFIHKAGKARHKQLGIHSDSFLPGLKLLTHAVHESAGKIVLQISHAGFLSIPESAAQKPLGPSPLTLDENSCLEMNRGDIQKTVKAFASAALRAKKAGFDGVQIHAAHHYLLAQFLSPFYNRRGDEYGGSVENRARIVIEVVQNVREVVGNSYPVMIKINSEDFLVSGFSQGEMLQVAMMLERTGIDAIELSGGTKDSGKEIPSRIGALNTVENEVYYREAAKNYKKNIGVPLMLVGGIRSYGVAKNMIDEELTDYIALSRPLIREPHLINRWETGDLRKSTCISCNACLESVIKGIGLNCVVEEMRKKNL